MRSAIALFAIATALTIESPGEASAAAAGHSYVIATRIVEQAPSAGEFDGALQLRVSPGGIVSGFYRPDDNERFIPVTGGDTGKHFWLDIGSFAAHPLRFNGTFAAGKIDAEADNVVFDDGAYTALELIGAPKTK